MKRRTWFGAAAATLAPLALGGCASPAENSRQTTATGLPALMGTGDLGVIIERADGALTFVNTSSCTSIGRVNGLGDLSHASVVFSRDERYAYVFGRDGGLTKVDLLTQAITGRVMQAGNSIGGAINADGTLVAAQNYTPAASRSSAPTRSSCWRTCRRSQKTASAHASWVWRTCRKTASSTASSIQTPSASRTAPTSPPPGSRRWKALADNLMTPC